MDRQVIVDSMNDVEHIYSEKSYSFPTAFSRIHENVRFEELMNDAELLQKEFQSKILRLAEEEGNTDILLEFVRQHVSAEGDSRYGDSSSDDDRSDHASQDNVALSSSSVDENVTPNSVQVLYSRENEEGADDLDEIPWLKLPFVAITKGRHDIIEMCYRTGIDLNIFKWMRGMNLLMYAFHLDKEKIDEKMTQYLLQHIRVDHVTDNGETALNICLANTSLSAELKLRFAQLLINAGIPLNVSKGISSSALQAYINSLVTINEEKPIERWQDFLDIFASAQVDVNARDWVGQTALMGAIVSVPPQGYEESMEDEIQRKVMLGIRREKINLIQHLLQLGADPNVKDSSGRNSVHIAVSNQSEDVLRMIIDGKGDVNAQSYIGATPAYYMIFETNWSIENDVDQAFIPLISMLVNAGCDLNIRGIDQSSALHYAAAKLDHYVCSNLLRLGANVNAQDYLKRTPLHMAARNKNAHLAQLLIEHGADVDARDVNHCTPLHAACLFDNVEFAKALVDRDADIAAVGNFDIQPIHLAAENGEKDLIEYFADIGNLATKDQWGATPLHYAASDGNLETVKYLTSIGVNVTVKDVNNRTPLDFAIYRGYLKVAQLLVPPETEIKFGCLPPDVFPNRPLVPFQEADRYFDDLIQKFNSCELFGENCIRAIMQTKGLGCVDFESGENKEIRAGIIALAEDILRRVEELDPLFQCSLIPAGSSAEGLKVGYPDEFDFICNIRSISGYIERLERGETPGFTMVVIKESSPEKLKKFCVRKGNVLNASSLLRHFGKLCRLAIFDVLSTGKYKFYSGMMLLNESGSLFTDAPLPLSKLFGVHLHISRFYAQVS